MAFTALSGIAIHAGMYGVSVDSLCNAQATPPIGSTSQSSRQESQAVSRKASQNGSQTALTQEQEVDPPTGTRQRGQRDSTSPRNPNQRGESARRGDGRGGGTGGDAQSGEARGGNNNRRANIEITAERRAELITFVRDNNPPIERLLNNLESKNPAQFRLALQAMARDVQLLEDLKSRDPQRYELSLELWRNRSRLDLLAAQIALQPETRRPALRRQMHQVMEQQNELRGKLLDLELQRVSERQSRLEKSREELRSLTDADIRRQVNEVINRGRRNLERSDRADPDRADPGGADPGRENSDRSNSDRSNSDR